MVAYAIAWGITTAPAATPPRRSRESHAPVVVTEPFSSGDQRPHTDGAHGVAQSARPAMPLPTSLAPSTSSTTIMMTALCSDMNCLIASSGPAARSVAKT